jgi:hypothetical protein
MQYVKYMRKRKIEGYSVIINQAKISSLLFPIFCLTQYVSSSLVKSDGNQVEDIHFYVLNIHQTT